MPADATQLVFWLNFREETIARCGPAEWRRTLRRIEGPLHRWLIGRPLHPPTMALDARFEPSARGRCSSHSRGPRRYLDPAAKR
jgi:hypothetical protein